MGGENRNAEKKETAYDEKLKHDGLCRMMFQSEMNWIVLIVSIWQQKEFALLQDAKIMGYGLLWNKCLRSYKYFKTFHSSVTMLSWPV